VLFLADEGHQQKVDEVYREAPFSGKDVTPPTTAVPQQSRVKVELPLVEDILRYPIEVFVSGGEAFIHPESTFRCFSHLISDFVPYDVSKIVRYLCLSLSVY